MNITILESIVEACSSYHQEMDGTLEKLVWASGEEKDTIWDTYQGIGKALGDVTANIIPFENCTVSIEKLIEEINSLVDWMDSTPYGYTIEVWLESCILVRDILDQFIPGTMFTVQWVVAQ